MSFVEFIFNAFQMLTQALAVYLHQALTVHLKEQLCYMWGFVLWGFLVIHFCYSNFGAFTNMRMPHYFFSL